MEWWLYSEQEDIQDEMPVLAVVIIYVALIAVCLFIQALVWPENKPVTFEFFIPSVLLPACVLTTILFFVKMVLSATVCYAEIRKYIAKSWEVELKTYARKNIALAAWNALTPLEQPALNMLKLEGEFPLAPKTPLRIEIEDLFEQTRNEQIFTKLLTPMAMMLNGNNYRGIEIIVWVRGGDNFCVDALRRVLEHLNIPNANACEIEYLTECPEYGMVDKWIAAPDDNVINRIVITVDMHEEDSDSKSMESACAFLFTNHYVRGAGEKPVYLYQPMSGVTDVEEKMPVYLEVESVIAPKTLWYTGLSRVDKYPLLQALDAKNLASERLDMEASLGEKSAGYRWLALALAADAVRYAQGEQLVATSENNKFAITSLSSKKTNLPDKAKWGHTIPPVVHSVIVSGGLMISWLFYNVSFTPKPEHISTLWIVASIVIPAIIAVGAGLSLTVLAVNKAYQHMGY
ncbi:hypothetical protein [Klebsiella aerogenes]|uniref:hypothetical protein n=1 Tax=Klebsiella aerogenes TaxID=548 RepID=UPI0028127A0D|nr:hypothetical protein [Klebsiella aerogenes]